MTTKTGAALEQRRPQLWWTESKLGEGLANLQAADPEERMSEEQAAEFIAQFVSTEAVAERRDEFAGFLLEAEAMAVAKRLQAREIAKQADDIEDGLERMRAEAVKFMKAAGVKALSGVAYTMKLKDSPGSVEVTDEALIPAPFWRTKLDSDTAKIHRLVQIVERIIGGEFAEAGLEGEALEAAIAAEGFTIEARGLLAEAENERRAVDKNAIKAAWKDYGLEREVVDEETGEMTMAPTVPGAAKAVTTKLVVA